MPAVGFGSRAAFNRTTKDSLPRAEYWAPKLVIIKWAMKRPLGRPFRQLNRGSPNESRASTRPGGFPPDSVPAPPSEPSHSHWAKASKYITQVTAANLSVWNAAASVMIRAATPVRNDQRFPAAARVW